MARVSESPRFRKGTRWRRANQPAAINTKQPTVERHAAFPDAQGLGRMLQVGERQLADPSAEHHAEHMATIRSPRVDPWERHLQQAYS